MRARERESVRARECESKIAKTSERESKRAREQESKREREKRVRERCFIGEAQRNPPYYFCTGNGSGIVEERVRVLIVIN